MLATLAQTKPGPRKPAGFTLVELLVVIAIIGILVSLTMPAINAARESGRRTVCINNLSQLAKGCNIHETQHRFLPGGGWGWGWVGDADRGVGIGQPGGWIYNLLPFIDHADLHDMGKSSSTAKADRGARVQRPLPETICPTRRAVVAFPYTPHGTTNYDAPAVVARSDYASNGGDKICQPSNIGLWSSNCGDPDCGPTTAMDEATLGTYRAKVSNFDTQRGPNGTDFPLATLPTAKIQDGLSFTYLLGEKSINPKYYLSGKSKGDNENLYIGHNANITRWTDDQLAKPSLDRAGVDNDYAFGSAHAAGFHMAFCDGSVRKMAFDINPVVHRQLGNRQDGQPTQLQNIDPATRNN